MTEALLILNGKKADRPEIRQAVNTLRDAEHQLDVRVTWEAGDMHRHSGEPYSANQIRFSVQASAIKVVLPPDCPCIQ